MLKIIHDFISRQCPPGATIIETGAGNSTISFLFTKPKRLVTIASDAGLFERITTSCTSIGLSHDALEPEIDESEWALSKIAAAHRSDAVPPFDFGLIDGCHNWLTVMLDFYYINFLVRRGGYIMVDDINRHPVRELARLMALDKSNFALRRDDEKFLIFEKIGAQRELPEWDSQPYVREMSNRTVRPYDLGLGAVAARLPVCRE
jgi:hypothetical protein